MQFSCPTSCCQYSFDWLVVCMVSGGVGGVAQARGVYESEEYSLFAEGVRVAVPCLADCHIIKVGFAVISILCFGHSSVYSIGYHDLEWLKTSLEKIICHVIDKGRFSRSSFPHQEHNPVWASVEPLLWMALSRNCFPCAESQNIKSQASLYLKPSKNWPCLISECDPYIYRDIALLLKRNC